MVTAIKSLIIALILLFALQWLACGSLHAESTTLWREGGSGAIDPDLDRLGRAFVSLAHKVQPAVVQVRGSARKATEGNETRERSQSSRGSGFIINAEGYILTAHHVVDAAKEVEVLFPDRRRFPAKIFAIEPQLDIALLKIDPQESLPLIPLGDSDRLRAGELVSAVSYPFGRESSMSLGIVSRYSRLESRAFGYQFIQTDTSVGPGSSGGPLINMRGDAIGMITMASQTGNMGFAVPIGVIKKALPKLLQNEKFAWGWLGIRVTDVTMEIARSLGLSPARGVVIASVLPGQPAEKSDLLPQDVVLSVDGAPIDSPREFTRMISGFEAGNEVTLTIFRKGKVLSRSILLGTRPQSSEGREG
jgi:serine protease Do